MQRYSSTRAGSGCKGVSCFSAASSVVWCVLALPLHACTTFAGKSHAGRLPERCFQLCIFCMVLDTCSLCVLMSLDPIYIFDCLGNVTGLGT